MLTAPLELSLTAQTVEEPMAHELTRDLTQARYRTISLFEPLLSLAMLRGIKKHEMRKQRFRPGLYLLHTGRSTTPDAIAQTLRIEWPGAPDSAELTRGAIYGLAWFGAPAPVNQDTHGAWAQFGAFGMPVLRTVEFAEPVANISGKLGAWHLEDAPAQQRIVEALRGSTYRVFPASRDLGQKGKSKSLPQECRRQSPKAQSNTH